MRHNSTSLAALAVAFAFAAGVVLGGTAATADGTHGLLRAPMQILRDQDGRIVSVRPGPLPCRGPNEGAPCREQGPPPPPGAVP